MAPDPAPQPPTRRRPAKRLVQLGVLALVVAATVTILVMPLYTVESGAAEVTSGRFLEVNGPWAVVGMMVPIAVALLPLFTRGRAWQSLSIASAALLTMFVLAAFASIGLFYAPAAVAAIVAACLPEAPRT
ncbi:hypothetical protein [Georgenia halophila]